MKKQVKNGEELIGHAVRHDIEMSQTATAIYFAFPSQNVGVERGCHRWMSSAQPLCRKF